MTNLISPTNLTYHRFFRRLTLFTVITVYLLIIAGGIVRSTGAGMGCPDWPKCFGSWIPPTEASQLPLNYKEIYGAKLKGQVEFNAVKTWIEYINRLLGVFTGILIFFTLLASIPFLCRGKANLFYTSLMAFILVGFQGWLGSKVVSTELHPVTVTLHMVMAIIIVFILLYVHTRSSPRSSPPSATLPRELNIIILFVIVLSFVQVIMGTQVREAMDVVISRLGYTLRNKWIEQLGLTFYVHRSFSILVLIVNVFLYYRLRKIKSLVPQLIRLAQWIVLLILFEIITGIIMAYFSVPAFAQPLHLTIAIVLVGIQFVMWLTLSNIIKFNGKALKEVGVYI